LNISGYKKTQKKTLINNNNNNKSFKGVE